MDIQIAAAILTDAADSKTRHDKVGIFWQNLPPKSSFAGKTGQVDWDTVRAKKIRALRKSFPELCELLDDISANTRRV